MQTSTPHSTLKTLSGKGDVESPLLKNNNIHATDLFALINPWFIRIHLNPDKVFIYQSHSDTNWFMINFFPRSTNPM